MIASRVLALASLCALVPAVAAASNGTHPRTPVEWNDVPCMTLHDRSAGATFHLPYDIPMEDTDVTPDEVADSRTHQFFAYCRPHHPQDFLPTWITQDDIDAAIAKNLLKPGTVDAKDLLTGNPAWEDCWYRIIGDDERRPITFAAAAEGVDWDTSVVPAGPYTLYGYTYEPVFNIWHLRPGVVKVFDGDPDSIGPAGAVITGELTPYKNDKVMIEGCVDAMPGTTFTASWALTDIEPQWVPYVEDASIDGDMWMFELTPPEAMWGESAMLRIDFTDPMGRVYTTYQADPMLVINADNPDACDQGGSFIGTPCDTSGSDSGSGTGDDAGASTGGSGDSGASATGATAGTGGQQTGDDGGTDPSGCACSQGDAGPTWESFAMITLVAAGRRRRRSP